MSCTIPVVHQSLPSAFVNYAFIRTQLYRYPISYRAQKFFIFAYLQYLPQDCTRRFFCNVIQLVQLEQMCCVKKTFFLMFTSFLQHLCSAPCITSRCPFVYPHFYLQKCKARCFIPVEENLHYQRRRLVTSNDVDHCSFTTPPPYKRAVDSLLCGNSFLYYTYMFTPLEQFTSVEASTSLYVAPYILCVSHESVHQPIPGPRLYTVITSYIYITGGTKSMRTTTSRVFTCPSYDVAACPALK